MLKKNIKQRKYILLFFLMVLIFYVVAITFNSVDNNNRKEWLNTVEVQFSGKIVETREVMRKGRITYINCVKIDYSNVDSIMITNKKYYVFLKIKDGFTTLVLPENIMEGDSVVINMNNDRKERYYRNGILIDEFPLSLSRGYATDEDMEICDNINY